MSRMWSPMNQNLIKSYTGRNYKHTTMVRHKGTIVAFAMDDARRIDYAVLDLDSGDAGKGPLDADHWPDNPTPLRFPNEIAQVGYGLIGATRLPVVAASGRVEQQEPGSLKADEIDPFLSTTARLTADAPFLVMSDNRHIYVFRQSIDRDHGDMVHKLRDGGASGDGNRSDYVLHGDDKIAVVHETLLVDRFILARTRLEPTMEIRYKRSRDKLRPASNADGLGAKDMEGNYFYEPTHELDFIRNLGGGRFSALLLPTQIAEVQRWQIFAHNSKTGRIDSFNVERATDGLFNTKGTQLYTSPDPQYRDAVLERSPGTCPFTDQPLIPLVSTRGHAESCLELLFVALELAVGALDEAIDAGGLVCQARDLQDAITSHWRKVDDARDDELPF